jgi:molybdate transport system ATP-binding protein
MRLEVSVAKHLGAFALEAEFASDGGVTALFGRSGSGKTSVLNAVAGLLRPERGRIALDGEPMFDASAGVDVAAHRRRIGYVFQEGRLLPHLTVRQNLLFGRRFKRGPDAVTLDRVTGLLGLAELLERRPHDLSGGEKQRVAIGRALLAHPRLLLMDEPLAALDAPRKSEILYYVERLRDELRVPIVYVSHSLDEVVRLADTVVVMSEGRVLDYLGRFEGGAVIEARVAEQDLEMGLARLDFPGGALYAPDVDALVGERVRVRIRARDVSLATVRPESISMLNVLPGTLKALGESAGASVDVQIDVAGTILLARVTRKSVAALGLVPGRPVYALVKAVAIDRHSVGWA